MKVGLVLSGGGIRGIAHAGVIKALEEQNIPIDILGGTSSGSMVAILYAMGYKADEIYNLFKEHSKNIVKVNRKVIGKEIKNFILKHDVECQGMNNGKYIEEIFGKLAKEKEIFKIQDVKMPLVMPCVDIGNSKEYIFTSVDNKKENWISNIEVGKAVRASCSFPIVYEPVKYDNKLLLDGGILDNSPVDAVKELGAEKVIVVNFDSNKVEEESNAIDIMMKVSDIMAKKIAEKSLEKSNYVITVPTDGTGILDTEKIDFCYKSGYKTTKEQIDKILKII